MRKTVTSDSWQPFLTAEILQLYVFFPHLGSQGTCRLQPFKFCAFTFIHLTSLSFCVSSWEEERFMNYVHELGQVRADF